MSEEAAPAAAPEAAPSPAPTAPSQPVGGAAPASTVDTPTAQEAGDAVGEAMEAQGVSDPGDLDWSRTVTVTVDGQERTVPLSELRGNYELRRSSFERFEEAKRLREGAEAEKKRLQEIAGALRDPSMTPAVLRELGFAPDQLKAVQEALAAELALPEDQRRMRELEQRERQLQEREQAYQRKLAQEQAAKEQQMFRSAFNEALDPHGLADNPNAMRMMAQYLGHRYTRQPGARMTQADVSKLAVEAASYAAEELAAQRRQAVSAIDPGTLAKLLTPEQAQALREQRVQEYREGKAPPPAASKPKPKKASERVRMNSIEDFRRALDGE